MKLDCDQFYALGRFLKRAQAYAEPNLGVVLSQLKRELKSREKAKTKKRPKKTRSILVPAYPEYGRSIVTQQTPSPLASGVTRGLQAGTLGAILSALAARMATQDPKLIGTAAGIGGLATAIPGYMAGKRQAESEKSKLLFLRRLGINTPGELEAALRFPSLIRRITEEGVSI